MCYENYVIRFFRLLHTSNSMHTQEAQHTAAQRTQAHIHRVQCRVQQMTVCWFGVDFFMKNVYKTYSFMERDKKMKQRWLKFSI